MSGAQSPSIGAQPTLTRPLSSGALEGGTGGASPGLPPRSAGQGAIRPAGPPSDL